MFLKQPQLSIRVSIYACHLLHLLQIARSSFGSCCWKWQVESSQSFLATMVKPVWISLCLEERLVSASEWKFIKFITLHSAIGSTRGFSVHPALVGRIAEGTGGTFAFTFVAAVLSISLALPCQRQDIADVEIV